MCALTITSCGSTTAESEVSSEPTTSVSDTTAASEPEFDVPEVNDYDGYEFRMIINENRNADSSKLYAAEENGEVINDAVFDRNRAVSENYNITIVGLSDKNNTVDETLKTSVLAGEDLCDFAAVPARKHFPLAQENVLIELNALDCIDFSMPWWDESILEAFQVNGKNYTVTGDISTEDDIYALIMLFNKKLYGDLGFEDPYTLVSDGRWVYDTFYKMAKSGSSDLNGDGKMDQSDRWGFITENEAWYYYSTGADMPTFQQLFLDEGAQFAFNLDGGGSTTLYFLGEVINIPSSGKERSVSDVIMFMANPS